jgi:hypothetical protein
LGDYLQFERVLFPYN